MLRLHQLTAEGFSEWNDYVYSHSDGTIDHLAEWSVIFKRTIGYTPLYFFIVEDCKTIGLLPFFKKKGLFKSVIATVNGGVLLDDEKIIDNVIKIFFDLKIVASVGDIRLINNAFSITGWNIDSSNVMVRRNIPANENDLWKGIPSKRRNLIRKALKNDLTAKFIDPCLEDIDDFYRIYARNYRDLGTPVRSKSFFVEQINRIPQNIKMQKVFYNQQLIGVMWLQSYGDELADPEAASLRRFFHTKVNDFMYYKAFEYAMDNGFSIFNMGRSQINTGTYKFKKSWGDVNIDTINEYSLLEKPTIGQKKKKYNVFIMLWQKLPVGLTTLIGPFIRKILSLD